ncbi:transcription-repair coupling factor [Candidatus Margulisiibacteriota bacterium]
MDFLSDKLSSGSRRIVINALPQPARAVFFSTLIKQDQRPFLIVTAHLHEAVALASTIGGELFPAPDGGLETTAARLKLLNTLPKIIVAPLKALMRKTTSKLEIRKSRLEIRANTEYSVEQLISKFVQFGYTRQEIVGERGEFAVRGGIVDIFFDDPVRIEFFGEKVESIRSFDCATQRSIKKLGSVTIYPTTEEGNTSFFEHLDKKTVIFWDEPMKLRLIAERNLDEEVAPGVSFEEIENFLKNFQVIENNPLEDGIKIGLSDFGQEALTQPEKKVKKPKKPAAEGINRELLLELKAGDLVVHENYGIGIYGGMQKMEVDQVTQEYLLINYAKEDRLFVPLQQMGLIEKYSGGVAPKIHRLSGGEWKKTRQKIEKGLEKLTKDLLLLYAVRNKSTGFSFPSESEWQHDLAGSFQYEETADQRKAISDVKKDMESALPMDRLVLGDVGYGKTEVALRASFKAAVSGKQVAVLAPTTILVEQHYATFEARLKPYPVKVAGLSRFKSKEEQKIIVEQIKNGEIDIVIGTHRLLQKDITFADLGLLIIDEEQRFGVGHKEKIKQFKKNVDVLTLSATPIPRTLNMSLSGVRDMSLINTAPLDRLPIRTHVLPWNESLIKEVIDRELDRGGQVYFVHNFVQTINNRAKKIKELIPDAKVGIAHGQMREFELAKVMRNFLERKYDVLVCTTIIESGLDIPNVNTMLVDHAERFGLAQLYQLRGRIGRSPTRAYAYLLYHKEELLTEVALERLKAIQEFTRLGSGYRLALRDLEIRGAGTLLGARQSGHIAQIGFDMYCDLLEEAVRKAKGIEIPAPRQVVVDIKISAYIPDDYITDEKQRIATYRRLTLLDSTEKLQEMKKELIDRFGKIPQQLKILIKIIQLKIIAQKAGIKIIREEGRQLYVEWFDGRHKLFKKPNSDILLQVLEKKFRQ